MNQGVEFDNVLEFCADSAGAFVYITKLGEMDILSQSGEDNLTKGLFLRNPISFKDLNKKVIPEDRECLDAFRESASLSSEEAIEFTIDLYGKKVRYIEKSYYKEIAISGKKTPVRVAVVRCIDAEKALEEIVDKQQSALVEARSQADIGRLTRSVIHEINSQLTAAMLNSIKLEKELRFLSKDHERYSVLSDLIGNNKQIVEKIIRTSKEITQLYMTIQSKKTAVRLIEVIEKAIESTKTKSDNSLPHIQVINKFSENSIECNEQCLIQVIENLINNALEATAGTVNPKIELTIDKVSESMAQIVVEDNGKGIDVKPIRNIFLSGVSTKGSGLGLYVSKKVVEDHNGFLSVKQTDEKTQFTIELPIEQPKERTLNVLVVDDEQDIVELVQDVLKERGYRLFLAASGSEALEILQVERIDVLLADVVMPQVNGIDLLQNLHAIYPERVPPNIYMMSGYVELDEDVIKKYNIKQFFQKPFDVDEFAATNFA